MPKRKMTFFVNERTNIKKHPRLPYMSKARPSALTKYYKIVLTTRGLSFFIQNSPSCRRGTQRGGVVKKPIIKITTASSIQVDFEKSIDNSSQKPLDTRLTSRTRGDEPQTRPRSYFR